MTGQQNIKISQCNEDAVYLSAIGLMFEKVNILRSIVVVVVVVVVVTCSSEGDNNIFFTAQITRHFFTVLPEDAHLSCPQNVTFILILNRDDGRNQKSE